MGSRGKEAMWNFVGDGIDVCRRTWAEDGDLVIELKRCLWKHFL